MTDVAGSGTSGAVGRAALVAPLVLILVVGTAQNYGSAAVVMPAGALSPTGRAVVSMPAAYVVGEGAAVTPDVYATYALNLYHPPRATGAPVTKDELTTYSNFSFDKVVRFKDDYYGVNKNGLFKLGGTTDFSEAAPTEVNWSFKTCMTDFGVEQLQSVDSAYFGGRLGPQAAVTLFYGDEGAESYSYETPRDSSAQNYRQLFGRGIRARYFALGVSGSGAMSLDSVVFSVTTLTRTV